MVSNDDVPHRIRTILLERLNINVPAGDVDMLGTGILDSLLLVDLIFNLETEFEITIPLESLELDKFRSIASVAAFVSGMLAADHAAPASRSTGD